MLAVLLLLERPVTVVHQEILWTGDAPQDSDMAITSEHLLILLSLLAAPTVTAHAESYHMDSINGNDRRDGLSPATAWMSLEKANATAFRPGDRLLLKCGSKWIGQLHPRGSGNATKRIILNSYGKGPPPVIHGGGTNGGAILLENQEYWSIQNVEVTNDGSPAAKKVGILIRNNAVGTLSGIEVKGCYIHNVTGDMAGYRDGKESGAIVFCIAAGKLAVPSKWKDICIESNTVYDVSRNGILMQSQWINKPGVPNSYWSGHGPYTTSTDIRVAGNRLENVGGDGIILWCCKGAVVERNFVRKANNNSLKQGHAAVWPYFCEDVVFQYNEVCETRTIFDGMAFDFDNGNQRCIYQYNYSHDNEGGFLNMCCDGNANGNIARYNISQNDGCADGSRVFLVHGNGNHDYQIYNNTVYARNGNPVMFHQGSESVGSSIVFRNNIFINAGSGAFRTPQGCSFERNLYFGSGHIPENAKLLRADPLMVAPGEGRYGLDSVGCYKLYEGSPAIGAGVFIPGNGGFDFWRNRVHDHESTHLGAFNGAPVVKPLAPGGNGGTRQEHATKP